VDDDELLALLQGKPTAPSTTMSDGDLLASLTRTQPSTIVSDAQLANQGIQPSTNTPVENPITNVLPDETPSVLSQTLNAGKEAFKIGGHMAKRLGQGALDFVDAPYNIEELARAGADWAAPYAQKAYESRPFSDPYSNALISAAGSYALSGDNQSPKPSNLLSEGMKEAIAGEEITKEEYPGLYAAGKGVEWGAGGLPNLLRKASTRPDLWAAAGATAGEYLDSELIGGLTGTILGSRKGKVPGQSVGDRKALEYLDVNDDVFDAAREAVERGDMGTLADVTGSQTIADVEAGVARADPSFSRSADDVQMQRQEQVVEQLRAPFGDTQAGSSVDTAAQKTEGLKGTVDQVKQAEIDRVRAEAAVNDAGVADARARQLQAEETLRTADPVADKAATSQAIEGALLPEMPDDIVAEIRATADPVEAERIITKWWNKNAFDEIRYTDIKNETPRQFEWDDGLRDELQKMVDADPNIAIAIGDVVSKVNRIADRAVKGGLVDTKAAGSIVDETGNLFNPESADEITSIDGDTLLAVRNWFAVNANDLPQGLKGSGQRSVADKFDDMIERGLGKNSKEFERFSNQLDSYGNKVALERSSKNATSQNRNMNALDISRNAVPHSALNKSVRQRALAKGETVKEAQTTLDAAMDRQKVKLDADAIETKMEAKATALKNTIDKKAIGEYAKDAPTTLKKYLKSSRTNNPLKSLYDDMKKAGKGEEFRADVREQLIDLLYSTNNKGRKVLKLADNNLDQMKKNIVDAGILTEADVANLDVSLAKEAGTLAQRSRAVGRHLDDAAQSTDIPASAATAGIMAFVPGGQNLMVVGATRRMLKRYLDKNAKNPDAIRALERFILKPSEYVDAASKAKTVEEATKIMLTRAVGASQAAALMNEEE
jgi:hypothetical protein